MAADEIAIRIDPFPAEEELAPAWQAAWGEPYEGDLAHVLSRSLVHAAAYRDERLVGFVNVAWDGGQHAFLLDPTVDPEFQRRGIARRLVEAVSAVARDRGARWLHVDYLPALAPFYAACGFKPTAAGLRRLA